MRNAMLALVLACITMTSMVDAVRISLQRASERSNGFVWVAHGMSKVNSLSKSGARTVRFLFLIVPLTTRYRWNSPNPT